ncbi:ABC transporter transmembrane domain-containing protein [Vallitalea guaymasensis]|uniref:ABC transporter ATP-binding protein n=1 Tax=Vallitalea guaymasensis TaxID=1185412 RepID=A0A8J8MBF8_9FIRM|nr:ABC transporter ATP-binding protein [Vallitalea guaymasensis]QUH29817.1 ABC transporter ATP-binding protein [Vallitalea guaymasensis]
MNFSFSELKNFFRLVIRYKKEVIIGIILIFIPPLIMVQIPLKVKEIFDEIIPEKDIERLVISILMIAIMFLTSKIIEFIHGVLFYEINCKIVKNIRAELFNKVINSNFKELNNFKIGDLITRIEDDIKNTRVFFVDNVARMLSNFISLLISIYMMIRLSYILSSISLCSLVLYIIISIKFRRKIEVYSEKYIEKITKSKSILIEFLNNIDVIKINNHNKFISEIYDKTLVDKRDANIQLGKTRKFGTTLIESLLNITPYFIIFLGGIFVINDYFTIGSIIAFIEYIKKAMKNLENINEYNFDIGNAKISLRRINEIYNLQENNLIDNSKNKTIFVENLTVSRSNRKLINKFNLEVLPYDKIAIWGISGSGKTTFLKILLGIDYNYSGNIYTSEYTNKNYFYIGSYIKSDPYVIQGNLKDNILMGKKYNKEKYYKVLKDTALINLNDTINIKNCSHGEKQKICLARALYSESNIILIDEGLSNIDVIDLNKIMDNLINIRDLTIVMITHNLDIVKKFKKIIHFDQKEISLKSLYEFQKDVDIK